MDVIQEPIFAGSPPEGWPSLPRHWHDLLRDRVDDPSKRRRFGLAVRISVPLSLLQHAIRSEWLLRTDDRIPEELRADLRFFTQLTLLAHAGEMCSQLSPGTGSNPTIADAPDFEHACDGLLPAMSSTLSKIRDAQDPTVKQLKRVRKKYLFHHDKAISSNAEALVDAAPPNTAIPFLCTPSTEFAGTGSMLDTYPLAATSIVVGIDDGPPKPPQIGRPPPNIEMAVKMMQLALEIPQICEQMMYQLLPKKSLARRPVPPEGSGGE